MGINKININNNDSNYAHSIFDISEYTGKTYDTLTDALADVPTEKQSGGMTIRYIQKLDNEYVQYRLMSSTFNTTEANWQGVDDEPTARSDNFVKSGGIFRNLSQSTICAKSGIFFCELGGFGADGKLNNSESRGRIIINTDEISNIDIPLNSGIKFCVFGNNDGVGHGVTQVIGWTTKPYTVNTQYEYLFIMVANYDDSIAFTETPALKLVFNTDFHFGGNVIDEMKQRSIRPVSSCTLFEEFDKVNNRISDICSYQNEITEDITFNAGGFYNLSGDLVTASNWSYSDKINISQDSRLIVRCISTNLNFTILFFDRNDNPLISESIAGKNTTGQYDYQDYVINKGNIPKNAVKCAISGFTATYDNKQGEIFVYDFDDVSYIPFISHDYKDVTEDVDFKVGGFYNLSGNWQESPNWASSDFIPTKNCEKIEFHNSANSLIFSIAFFDAGKNIITSESISVGPSSGASENIITVDDIPLDAFYFVASTYTAGGYVEKLMLKSYHLNVEDDISKLRKYVKDVTPPSPIKELKDVTLIIIYGQSLSVGADAAAISTTPKYDMAFSFSQGVKARESAASLTTLSPLIERGTETPARGLAESFMETIMLENAFSVYCGDFANKKLILSCPGAGGATIAELTDNSNYQYLENIITAVKNYCDTNNLTLGIPVWCFMQGEQDTKASMSASDYKTALLTLHNKVCTSIQTITGITQRPKCVVYQPECQSLWKNFNVQQYPNNAGPEVDNEFTFNYDHMGVPNAFVELLRDNNEFMASVPTYICDPCPETAGYWIHCSSESYKLLGAMLGYSIKKYLIDGISNKGVIPTDVSVSGNTIKVKFNVPCPPLVFDTNYIREVPHMGFNVIKSDNSDVIQSVSIFNDTVTIVCSESPIGCKLRYGMNGDYITIPDPTYNYKGVAGREHGARGNLRDSQGNYVQKYIENIKYPLHNWAYTFEKVLE